MNDWIQDLVKPELRKWEEFYRNRWAHDKIVRSTHGVNCTGGCSWQVYVKNGLVTWEMQQIDYPELEDRLPPYEPRGCQRGISASWYVYSPIRVKYPYVRGALLDLWRDAIAQHPNPVKAWESIVTDEAKRKSWQVARGKGGLRRVHWDEALDIVSSSCLYTAKTHGPDRVIGFSPIPAMSYLSYGAGSRFLQIFGGINLSFYDWYCDLPNAFPEVWGEQTDVCESADWYNSKYIVSLGSCLNMTRTPDVHFIAEARAEGAKFVVFAPDFSQVAKYADWWIPVNQGQDMALWMAVNHVILKEFFVDRKVEYFVDYLKRFSDAPFLIRIEKDGDMHKPTKFLTSDYFAAYKDEELAEWKQAVFDLKSNSVKIPKGSMGYRWADKKGNWNLKLQDGMDNSDLDPELTFLENKDDTMEISLSLFSENRYISRGIPVKKLSTEKGEVIVTTVFDLLMAQFGIDRGLGGECAKSYDDETPYTPAWQEKFSSIGRETVAKFAREFARNAEVTNGKSMVIVGAAINHWMHNNLNYRGPITSLMLTGCCGVNGGGMNHYVGQEKLTLMAPWTTIALGLDWQRPPRVQQAPLWHYINTDQWRYDDSFENYMDTPTDSKLARGHTADKIIEAVKLGWQPYYPQFNENTFEITKKMEEKGITNPDDMTKDLVQQLVDKKLQFSVEDPDAPENWPRTWFIWRGNALMSSAKGHEYFLRHYLGTHSAAKADEYGKEHVKVMKWHEKAPEGKMDLVIDLNFRMDTSAIFSDIILPAAMWYEKNDLNTTDLHSFIHPLGEAVPPSWESRSDWDIFKSVAKRVSKLATDYMPDPIRDIVSKPLAHDSPDEVSQLTIKHWYEGECEPIPGKTMPHFKVVERDFTKVYKKFISLGRGIREYGMAAHGMNCNVEDFYDELMEKPIVNWPTPTDTRCLEWGGEKYPSLEDALDAANIILLLAPETNGELAYRSFEIKSKKTGLDLTHLAKDYRSVRMTFNDISAQPRRTLTTPFWSGIVNEGRAYSAYCINKEELVPWRTLTGRQSFYLDHEVYIGFGEMLPTHKTKMTPGATKELLKVDDHGSMPFNILTPHGKWHIHSTYGDNLRMLTLSRGIEPAWMNDKDAVKLKIRDNDWVELFNDNGVYVTRACVSARIKPGTTIVYHSPERTYVPKSKMTGLRGGGHNSITRTRLNPIYLAGGYAQFTYGFNYWGPVAPNRDTFVYIRKITNVEW